jgi:hypothetical protein
VTLAIKRNDQTRLRFLLLYTLRRIEGKRRERRKKVRRKVEGARQEAA